MLKLELKINWKEFQLNEDVDLEKIGNSKIKKIGFLGRLSLKPGKDESIFFSKNCYIGMFNFLKDLNKVQKAKLKDIDLDEYMFGPSKRGDNYHSGPWGTSAFLKYKNGKLTHITYQVIGNRIMSERFIKGIEEIMIALYGNPQKAFDNKGISIWSDSNSQLMTEVNYQTQSSRIHYKLL